MVFTKMYLMYQNLLNEKNIIHTITSIHNMYKNKRCVADRRAIIERKYAKLMNGGRRTGIRKYFFYHKIGGSRVTGGRYCVCLFTSDFRVS